MKPEHHPLSKTRNATLHSNIADWSQIVEPEWARPRILISAYKAAAVRKGSQRLWLRQDLLFLRKRITDHQSGRYSLAGFIVVEVASFDGSSDTSGHHALI